MVFVRVRAFSCNYRDRALMLRMSTSALRRNYYVIGSDFVAEVIAAGRNVADLKPGDRVIPDNAYPVSGAAGVLPGVATNHASKEYLTLHRVKLMPIPDTMPDRVAAGFSIGAQTTFGMIRRIDPRPGEKVLLTSPRSNTSLFALSALRRRGVAVFGLGRSTTASEQLRNAGMTELFAVDAASENWMHNDRLVQTLASFADNSPFGGGFDAMIDPMADLYLDKAADLLSVGGRYITCGMVNQSQDLTGHTIPGRTLSLGRLAGSLMIKNITVHGNCIGSTGDLSAAVDDFAEGRLDVAVDSVIEGRDVGTFFTRTYESPDRFGKVIFRY
jgi:NADPH:quinone reductase-like Zn-dependent oxidoreductase